MKAGVHPKLSSDGHLFSHILNRNQDDDIPTYEDMEEFLRFLDKYVSGVVGRRELNKFYRMHPGLTLLDRLTDSDIAYAFLVFENGHEIWAEDEQVRRMNAAEKESYNKTKIQKYHVKKGTRLKVFMDGWLDEGRVYYEVVKTCINNLRHDSDFWNELIVHWKKYVRKNHKCAYEKKEGSLIANDVEDDSGEIEEAVLFEIHSGVLPLPGVGGYEEY